MKVSEILDDLRLGKSVAEFDDRLEKYFINTHTFNVLSDNQKDIIAGDKGTGKTALYKTLIKRYRDIDNLRDVEVVSAFNIAGNPIFQQLLSVPEQTEGQYIAFWKTYFLSLVGNWLLDNPRLMLPAALRRVEFFLSQANLKTADVSPGNIFSRLVARFPKASPVKSAEMEMSLTESGMPSFKPRVEFGQPSVVQPPSFYGVDYPAGLRLLDSALRDSNLTIWVALDRLDEAFLGYPVVELPALRALLRTYLDLQAISHLRLKLFVRKDLFRKVTNGGFVNLTHVNNQKIEIVWDAEDLLNLLMARFKDNKRVVENIGLDGLENEACFYRFFPQKISQGENQSVTWKWVLSRLRDGNGIVAPRNLIDFVENCREAQLRAESRNPREFSPDTPLFEADSVRKAHRALSATRVQDTLMAEFKDLAPYIEKFRRSKAEHNLDSLTELLGLNMVETDIIARSLTEIGFLEEFGQTYKIPMLYRDGLGITQGKAFSAAGAVSTSTDEDE